MSLLPITDLTSLMNQIEGTLASLEIQNTKLKDARKQSTSFESQAEKNLQQRIESVRQRIVQLEGQISSLQKQVPSARDFIKANDLAIGSDKSRWARLNARFVIGCIEHEHNIPSPRDKYLPSERGDKEVYMGIACSDKPEGFCVHHHQQWVHAHYAGYYGVANTEPKYRWLGYQYNKALSRYEKVDY